MQGSIAGAIHVLTEVVEPLGATTIVPGHGPVCGPEVIDDVLGYLRFVQDTARAGKDAERIVGNLHRAYAELDGAAPGAPIDAAAALGDMVTYNGGRPLSCLA